MRRFRNTSLNFYNKYLFRFETLISACATPKRKHRMTALGEGRYDLSLVLQPACDAWPLISFAGRTGVETWLCFSSSGVWLLIKAAAGKQSHCKVVCWVVVSCFTIDTETWIWPIRALVPAAHDLTNQSARPSSPWSDQSERSSQQPIHKSLCDPSPTCSRSPSSQTLAAYSLWNSEHIRKMDVFTYWEVLIFWVSLIIGENGFWIV